MPSTSQRSEPSTEPGADPSPDVRIGLGLHRPFPQDRTVLDLFTEQVRDRGDRPAVRYRDTTLTYAALDRAADTVAARLVALGVPRRSLVPLMATDGPEFPVGLLGILKVGAAFVPLDPDWPADRLATIAADLDPPAAVAVPGALDAADRMGLADRLALVELPPPPTDPADPTAPASPGEPAGAGRAPVPTDLIYGYYTSGSTGAPKCALNLHRGLVNRLSAMSRRFGDGARQVTLQNSRSTFDSAMWQVLWPLTSGGQVVLPHRDGILDLEQTALTIARYGVTITDFVPSVLAAFVSLLELRDDLRDAVSCLDRMLIGGEAANPAVVRRLRTLLPQLRVTNTYGPTECSIGSVFHDITDADTTRIPLGRPIDNTAAVVLDDQLGPVPTGTVGEIYLGGECVGAGYLKDPEKTRQALVPNPFREIDGELLYRTGDRGRFDPQGLLHFAGRGDDQVKIGGVRIELAEVARALAAHPEVGDAMAVVLGQGADRALVCCVSPRSARRPPTVAELRRYAAEKLPAELVPHRLMVLDSLPVNDNGKADRRALTALLANGPDLADPPAGEDDPPATPMEELVCQAWREVLGRESVSVGVTFSEYGGTSLTAYRLTVELSNRLGRPVRPRDLLTTATVRAQAALLATGVPTDRGDHAYAVRDLTWAPPQTLLLTGATGFVGAHLLADLLRHSDAKLVCLVRSDHPRDGVRRLDRTLERYRLTSARQLLPVAVNCGRVEVLTGDLATERFGLSEAKFARLAATLSGVVHAGATINFLAGYLEHRPTNVVGVQELIKLSVNGASRLHALSTLSIFPEPDPGAAPVREDQLPAPHQTAADGYSLSKYVAEQLLGNARGHGVSSVVYRLGEVWPHRELGIANPASVAHNLLYACARTGCYFDTEAAVDVTPVDVVSRFVAGCATGETTVTDGTLHLLWHQNLRYADAFAALAGRRALERVSYAEFRRRLERAAEPVDADARLARLSLVLPPPGDGAAAPAEFDQLFTPAGGRFDTAGFARHATDQPDDPVRVLDRHLALLSAVPHAYPAPGQRTPGRDLAGSGTQPRD